MLGEKNSPTAEQSRIISSPLAPRLVIAGAGSGKTATMADRVVWLVANGWVRPEEVLGVTFTRKAAGELATRIRAKLAALQRIAAADTAERTFSPPGCSAPTPWSPRSPPTTPTPAASCPTTGSGSASNGTSCCSAAPSPCSSRARSWRRSTATTTLPLRQVHAGQGRHPARRRVRRTPAGPGRGPRLAAWTGWPNSRRCPTSPTAKKNPSQAAGELSALLRTRASVAGHGGSLHGRQAGTRRPGLRRPRGPRRPGRQRDPARRGSWNASATKWCSWTSSRTPRTPSWSCFPGSSATATPSPPSGIPTSPSMASAARPPASSSTSSANSRSGVGAPADRAAAGVRRPPFAVAPTSYLTTAWRNGRNILAAANVISAPLSRPPPGPARPASGTPPAGVEVPPLQPSPAAVQGRWSWAASAPMRTRPRRSPATC